LNRTLGVMVKEKRPGAEGPSPTLFETSLILKLSSDLSARVKAFRNDPLLAVHARNLTEPHLTALFIGFAGSPLVDGLRSALAAPPWQKLDVEISGWGTFRRTDGTCNIHLRVIASTDLLAFHDWAVKVCRQLCWEPPEDTSGKHYRPHITVADGDLDPDPVLRALATVQLPRKAILSQPQFRAHLWKA
jgi:2'-5' RNA ligase